MTLCDDLDVFFVGHDDHRRTEWVRRESGSKTAVHPCDWPYRFCGRYQLKLEAGPRCEGCERESDPEDLGLSDTHTCLQIEEE